jgi:hypothetical protein
MFWYTLRYWQLLLHIHVRQQSKWAIMQDGCYESDCRRHFWVWSTIALKNNCIQKLLTPTDITAVLPDPKQAKKDRYTINSVKPVNSKLRWLFFYFQKKKIIFNPKHLEITLIILLNQFITFKSTKNPLQNPKSTLNPKSSQAHVFFGSLTVKKTFH